jgi:hypothetical protein
MATQKYYEREFIDRIIQEMDALPPYEETRRSKQQLIAELAPVIASLRQKGYTWKAVAETITNKGVPISAAVLRTYLRRSKKQEQGQTKRRRPQEKPSRGARRKRPS